MSTTTSPTPSVGDLLRAWRASQGKSQLELAMAAGVSSRHLSFVETGRSTPSREMILTLSEALAVPLRDRNALLHAAGFAPVYLESPLDGDALSEVRRALAHILEASLPNPTLVVNRRYDVLLANEAAVRVIELFAPEWRGRNNVALMVFDERGLKPAIVNWSEVALHIAHRLSVELAGNRSRTADDDHVLTRAREIERDVPPDRGPHTRPPAVLVPIQFRRGDTALDMFTTITTLGTPLDITLHELRIETLYPAHDAARAALAAILRAPAD